ncbi:MAG: ribosome silencing factor [Clostridia bacterium]|nr:ribosome silencing factor [Clostridia bacterium]
MTSLEKAKVVVGALEDKKADNIEVIDVSNQTSLGDYFIVASCQSTVQVRACADEVEEQLKKEGIELSHREGYSTGSWVLLDYGDVIVHVMQHEVREFYGIERLWDDAGEAVKNAREAAENEQEIE